MLTQPKRFVNYQPKQ